MKEIKGEKPMAISPDGLYKELNEIKRDISKLSDEISYFKGSIKSELKYINQRVNRFWWGISIIMSVVVTLIALMGGYFIAV